MTQPIKIRGVIVHRNGLVETWESPTWKAFAEYAVQRHDDPIGTTSPIERVFGSEVRLSGDDYLEEHSISALRRSLKLGSIGN